jgi:hypothetical protein
VPHPQPGYRQPAGLIEAALGGHAIVLDVDELNDRVPHEPTARELAEKARYPHGTRIPTHDSVPSGRLRLRILTGCPVNRTDFADTKTIRLEDRLSHVLQELQLRAAAQKEMRLHRERDEIARQLSWEEAVEVAKVAARDHHRAEIVQQEVVDWQHARELDDYLSALATHVATLTGQERSEADEWVAWVRDYRRDIDPLNHQLRLPSDPKFTSEVIKPFMGGLSPYGPNGGCG